jgi:formylmethanofuran dehydrogenase subunit E
MKGLKYIGEMMSSYQKDITKPFTKEVERMIRKKINPHKICDICLEDYTHQTKQGDKLCKDCYEDWIDLHKRMEELF